MEQNEQEKKISEQPSCVVSFGFRQDGKPFVQLEGHLELHKILGLMEEVKDMIKFEHKKARMQAQQKTLDEQYPQEESKKVADQEVDITNVA